MEAEKNLLVEVLTKTQNKTPEEFINDLKSLNLSLGEFEKTLPNLLQNKGQETSFYVVSESDDPCDLLLIGTEAKGSCQRINGEPNYNKCLVGYLMNGEIRPVVIRKGQSQEMIARSILRLMWDDVHNTPVILQEKIYTNNTEPLVEKTLNDWAIKICMD